MVNSWQLRKEEIASRQACADVCRCVAGRKGGWHNYHCCLCGWGDLFTRSSDTRCFKWGCVASCISHAEAKLACQGLKLEVFWCNTMVGERMFWTCRTGIFWRLNGSLSRPWKKLEAYDFYAPFRAYEGFLGECLYNLTKTEQLNCKALLNSTCICNRCSNTNRKVFWRRWIRR